VHRGRELRADATPPRLGPKHRGWRQRGIGGEGGAVDAHLAGGAVERDAPPEHAGVVAARGDACEARHLHREREVLEGDTAPGDASAVLVEGAARHQERPGLDGGGAPGVGFVDARAAPAVGQVRAAAMLLGGQGFDVSSQGVPGC